MNTIIIISATGIHVGKNATIEVKNYPISLGFVAAFKLFYETFPQATQIAIRKGTSDD